MLYKSPEWWGLRAVFMLAPSQGAGGSPLARLPAWLNEGLAEYGKRRATRRFNERFDRRERDRAPQETSP